MCQNKQWKANPFVSLSSGQDRLASWKELRHSITDLPEAEALSAVAEYWGQCPLSNFSYNPESPEDWLPAWEMISRGDWCRQMVAVAMEMTLRLAGWDASRLKLVYLRDYSISEELLILKIDGDYALNYIVGQVVEYPKTEQIITGIWQFDRRDYVSRAY
jgi:hypothetical protein